MLREVPLWGHVRVREGELSPDPLPAIPLPHGPVDTAAPLCPVALWALVLSINHWQGVGRTMCCVEGGEPSGLRPCLHSVLGRTPLPAKMWASPGLLQTPLTSGWSLGLEPKGTSKLRQIFESIH
jgi:hypothetical protein